MTERDWETDFDGVHGYYLNRCGKCELLFHGHKHRMLCRVCSPEGQMERMVAPVRDALDPVKRNIDLGEDQ